MRLTQLTGVTLILVGIIGYVSADTASITALFPALVGVILAAFGLVAQAPKFRRDAVHIAVLVGVAGIVAFFDNARHLPALLAGNDVARPQAVVMSAITVAILLTYLGLSIRSFRNARAARNATDAA